jgi:protein required for attachment to host cells
MTAWILVGDVAGARLFSAEVREDAWSPVESFEHPAGSELSREISDDGPPGRAQQSTGPGARHTAFERRTSPKEAEAERFAQQLATFLEHAIAQRRYDYLVLVAPPHFLGLVKNSLGKQAAGHLRSTIDKDLSALDAKELRERLVDEVFPTHARS